MMFRQIGEHYRSNGLHLQWYLQKERPEIRLGSIPEAGARRRGITVASTKALIKPELLGWARNHARVTLDDAANAANVAPETLRAWEAEAGVERPTVSQLRCLAAKYHFPLAVFYLPKPPADFSPLRDFRRLPDATDRTISAELAQQIRSAHERRELALELHEDLNEPVRPFRLKASLADAPESVGEEVRRFLGVNDVDQRKAARTDRAFDFWRRKLEEKDILVFVVSGAQGLDLKEMRGFAIARNQIPVIVVNGRDSHGGKCYTLLHELAHVLLGESALTNGDGGTAEEKKIERFCDAVSAAALMPRDLMLSIPQVKPSGERKWNDDELRSLANTIGVSREAFLLRLVTLRRTSWDFYMAWRRKFKDEYEAAAVLRAAVPKKPIAIKRSILLMSWNGRGFTRLVLRSYYDQRITLNDVSSYLGAKVKHIPALERATFQPAE
jgi:Zn-dependent peptidase ImmA (M78 family)/DNA-binding XRE family transcriptional regulator